MAETNGSISSEVVARGMPSVNYDGALNKINAILLGGDLGEAPPLAGRRPPMDGSMHRSTVLSLDAKTFRRASNSTRKTTARSCRTASVLATHERGSVCF